MLHLSFSVECRDVPLSGDSDLQEIAYTVGIHHGTDRYGDFGPPDETETCVAFAAPREFAELLPYLRRQALYALSERIGWDEDY